MDESENTFSDLAAFTPEMAEGLRIRGAISNTRSFGGTGFASNSAKIREGKCPPAPSVLPALYTIEQRCGFSIHFSSTQRIRPVIFHKFFTNKEDGASLKSYSVVYLLSERYKVSRVLRSIIHLLHENLRSGRRIVQQ